MCTSKLTLLIITTSQKQRDATCQPRPQLQKLSHLKKIHIRARQNACPQSQSHRASDIQRLRTTSGDCRRTRDSQVLHLEHHGHLRRELDDLAGVEAQLLVVVYKETDAPARLENPYIY